MNIQTKQSNKAKAALNKLHMPTYRMIEDVTPDEQLGKYSRLLWNKVYSDIIQAIEDNSKTHEELEAKVFHTHKWIHNFHDELPYDSTCECGAVI